MGKAFAARLRQEWPTIMLLVVCYGGWAMATTWLAALWLPLGIAAAGVFAALHSSLCHEVLHGHPTRYDRVNEALVFPALGLFVPYQRFRDTHLAHHRDEFLTDPYDDPESNYMDPDVWARLPGWVRRLLMLNNTLLGRMLIGPVVSQVTFVRGDWRLIRAGARDILRAWLWHVPAVAVVLWWIVGVSAMPVWAFVISAYLGFSILKIRTFLEHRAHEKARGRTVIIEDRGILALLFLNNNFHVVHHMHPKVPWYRLPAMYRARKAHYLARNDGYRYASYREVFARHFLRAKDPVPHPLWPRP